MVAMEIAEAFIEAKEDGKGPRRSILFLHVSAEEKAFWAQNITRTTPSIHWPTRSPT